MCVHVYFGTFLDTIDIDPKRDGDSLLFNTFSKVANVGGIFSKGRLIHSK